MITNQRIQKHEKRKKTHKIKFTKIEDNLLRVVVAQYGISDWNLVASKMGNRSARQCRDRWTHYLSPSTNNNYWTRMEDEMLINAYKNLGPHWGKISSLFPGRTAVSVRNRCCKLFRMLESLKEGNQSYKTKGENLQSLATSSNSSSNSNSEESSSECFERKTLPPISSLPFINNDVKIEHIMLDNFTMNDIPDFLLTLSPHYLVNVQ